MEIKAETKVDRDNFYNSTEWRKLRITILQRDNWECQWCKREGKVHSKSKNLIVDHIKELETHPRLALDPDNLRTLCFYHHEVRHDRMFKGNNGKKNIRWNDEWWG